MTFVQLIFHFALFFTLFVSNLIIMEIIDQMKHYVKLHQDTLREASQRIAFSTVLSYKKH